MGLFGKIDASEVSENPFYVAPDTYLCVLSEASLITTQAGKTGLALKWNIEDDESEYNAMSVSDWFNVHQDATMEEMTPQIKRDQSNMKKRLVTDLGVDPDDLETLDENLDSLVGIMAYITVKESTDKNDPDKKYTNVSKVQRLED